MKCEICGKKYKYVKNKGMTKSKRHKLKEMSVKFLGGKCQICGYDRCYRSMAFHHVNPDEKNFSISSKHCRSWDYIKKELRKCVLLCSNCHGIFHNKGGRR